jgi:uncharacterized membrane protein YoaK (UPF0700 family)
METSSKLNHVSSQHSRLDPLHSDEGNAMDSLSVAAIFAFTGGSLDAFLYLNHGHVFAGVMTGNAVLWGVSVANHSVGGPTHYALPLLAYVCGILLIAIFQRYVTEKPARYALCVVIAGLFVMSLTPPSFPEGAYVFVVVLLTGFTVGISRRVQTYSYNATVLTGSLRDATTSLYQALNPAARRANLEESGALWLVMLSLLAGAIGGGLLGKHAGNHALWLPVFMLLLVLVMVVTGVSKRETPEQHEEPDQGV